MTEVATPPGGRGPVAAHFILYVADQVAATAFWTAVLDRQPRLNVAGMTEFALIEGTVLGLMPEAGIKALLGAMLPDPALARGVPRSELYLVVADPAAYHSRALTAGARELAPLAQRDWGDTVAYCLDLDGHVVAFAGHGQLPIQALLDRGARSCRPSCRDRRRSSSWQWA